MFGCVILGLRGLGFKGVGLLPPTMENQMDKNMKAEMDTGTLQGVRFRVLSIVGLRLRGLTSLIVFSRQYIGIDMML